jgi:hypothetical protein
MVRKYAILASQVLIMGTPVDKGRARANWQVTVGTPANGETGSTSAQEALDRNKAVIDSYRATSEQDLYVQNNVPYIKRLNEGWSAQAPAGFVEKGLMTAARALRGKVLR